MTEPSVNKASGWKSRLDLIATILLVAVTLMVGALALADRNQPARGASREAGVKPVLTSVQVPLVGSQLRGSRDAKFALVIFSDFECPVCRRAAREVMPEIEDKYIKTGQVLLVWRHYPLERHLSARGAAEAAECAGRQSKFWELHDRAFANQNELKPEHLRVAAGELGLDMPKFDKCVAGEAVETVTRDIALAKQLDVSGTPTWFLGTIEQAGTVKLIDRITGVGPVELFGKAIDNVVRSR